jgi:hypothetical protein
MPPLVLWLELPMHHASKSTWVSSIKNMYNNINLCLVHLEKTCAWRENNVALKGLNAHTSMDDFRSFAM